MANLIVGPNETFTTIQAAVNAAGPGDTILIRTGVYVEQVTIDGKNGLTLKPFDANSVVEIESPAVLNVNGTSATYGDAVRAVVAVTNSTNVRIEKITVDGKFSGDTTPGSNGDEISGIAYLESSGAIANVTIENVSNSPNGTLFGLQHGSGLFVDGGPGAPNLSFSATGSTITDFQKTGALITGVRLTFQSNTIEGVGATGAIGQNGVQAFNVQGTIQSNRISDFGYVSPFEGDETYSSGLIVFEPSGALRIENNIVQGATGAGIGSAGLDLSDTNGQTVTVQNNKFDDLGYGIVAYTFDPTIGLDPGPVLRNNAFSDIVVNGIYFDPELSGFQTTTPYTVDGGTADDFIAGSNGNDRFTGGVGDDVLLGRGGNDNLDGGTGDDELDGGSGNDTLNGGTGNDDLSGGMGTDTLIGGTGNDILRGGGDADTVDGGTGDDTIIDGNGADRSTGGAGRDTFDFTNLSGNNTITDFKSGDDTLEFGRVRKNGVVITDLDTNNDGRITAADGGNGGPNDFVRVVNGSLVFDFQEGTVTLQGVTSILLSDTEVNSAPLPNQQQAAAAMVSGDWVLN